MVDLECHGVVDFEVLIEVEPSPIKRLLPLWCPVHEDPGLLFMVEVYVCLKFGEYSIFNDYIALG